MDTTTNSSSSEQKIPSANIDFVEPTKNRHKTALRLRYEAEARVILKQIGGLEGARQQLGLSQRKICQLLLVDPSAWTRWGRDESKVPPHVIRSLQWYFALENKDPAWAQWREMILKREPDPQLDRWRRNLELSLESRIEKAGFRSKNGVEFIENSPPVATDQTTMDFQKTVERLEVENQKLAQTLERQGMIGVGWKLLLLFNTIIMIYLGLRALF